MFDPPTGYPDASRFAAPRIIEASVSAGPL